MPATESNLVAMTLRSGRDRWPSVPTASRQLRFKLGTAFCLRQSAPLLLKRSPDMPAQPHGCSRRIASPNRRSAAGTSQTSSSNMASDLPLLLLRLICRFPFTNAFASFNDIAFCSVTHWYPTIRTGYVNSTYGARFPPPIQRRRSIYHSPFR